MPLKRLPERRLAPLVRGLLTTEDDVTRALIVRLRPARRRGWLTGEELEAVCRWKSARAIHLIRANHPAAIRAATRRALAARSEAERLACLRTLKGVSVPMASALLTLLDPRRYGVLDIRVWQLLHALGAVTLNPGGTGFAFVHWAQFLAVVRALARSLGVGARDVERALFAVHRRYQRGLLYAATPRRARSDARRR